MIKVLKFFKKFFLLISILLLLIFVFILVFTLYQLLNNVINKNVGINKTFFIIIGSLFLLLIVSFVLQRIINKIIFKITKKNQLDYVFDSETYFLKNSPFIPQSFENDNLAMKKDFENIINIFKKNYSVFFLNEKKSGTTAFFKLIEKQTTTDYDFIYLDFKLVSTEDKILVIFYFLSKILPEKSYQKVLRIGNIISDTFINLVVTQFLKTDKQKLLSTDSFSFSDKKISLLNDLKKYLEKSHKIIFNKKEQKKICFLIDNLNFEESKKLILEISFIFSDFFNNYFFIFQTSKKNIDSLTDFNYFLKKHNFVSYEAIFSSKIQKELYIKNTFKHYVNKSKKNYSFANLKKFKEDLLLRCEKLSLYEINEKIFNFFC